MRTYLDEFCMEEFDVDTMGGGPVPRRSLTDYSILCDFATAL